MSNILEIDKISTGIRKERETRQWSLAELASRSNVSKAMISKIERGESSPTMMVLGLLCAAFGITLSTFLVRAEGETGQLARTHQQPKWVDGDTGITRTLISPNARGAIELITIDMPGGSLAKFPASLYAVFHQSIWIISGSLTVIEGALENALEAGDCLELGSPSQVTFQNLSAEPCQYLVAATKRS